MVKEKTAYFCEKSGCIFYSFSKSKTEEHEKIPVKKDRISGLVLLRQFDETYTIVKINGNLNERHEPLYTWDNYKGPELKKERISKIGEEINELIGRIIPLRGLEEDVVVECLMGERSRNNFLGKDFFIKMTSYIKEVYPERYPKGFEFRRIIKK
jgi:hypothetical protein